MAMEKERNWGLGDDCILWVKKRWIKIDVLAGMPFRCGRSARQCGCFSPLQQINYGVGTLVPKFYS